MKRISLFCALILSIAINAFSSPINFDFSLRIDGYTGTKSLVYDLNPNDTIQGHFMFDSDLFTSVGPNGSGYYFEDNPTGIEVDLDGYFEFNYISHFYFELDSEGYFEYINFEDIDCGIDINVTDMTFTFRGFDFETPNFSYYGTVEYLVDPPISTPEPTSILLVSLGLVAFLRKRK